MARPENIAPVVGGLVPQSMTPARIPLSTYRLQFNRDLTFARATELVPYLARLGISHCYASPFLRARPGSTHGYDIIDHNKLNPEIGSDEDFERFVEALHSHGMGQILDIVPNHMGVMGSDNAWWLDVLENGSGSEYAEYFDIDWEPLKDELQGKILVPILPDQYGNVLDQGDLRLSFDREKGEFGICYGGNRFPVNPREYPRILGRNLEHLAEQLQSKREQLLEFESLISAFSHLPSRTSTLPEQKTERMRDKEIHKRRLASQCQSCPEIGDFIEGIVRAMNGIPGESKSFDELHELIKAQAYRLANWRIAADDINYRRFFDINDLAGLRMENEAVFEVTHRLVLQLLEQGKIDGLRIDHPDGLYDPALYFERVQSRMKPTGSPDASDSKPVYVVIEKILTGNEELPPTWPVFGTTGYEFVNLVNGLFVDPKAVGKMDRVYRTFLGRQINFDTLLYRSKKLVMYTALASELTVLANLLTRIALSNRHTCDFTVNSLRDALARIVACFPVYRTYISDEYVSATDNACIEQAVGCAKGQSPSADASVFDFVRDVLLTRRAESQGRVYRKMVVRCAMKVQQFTSAVMAKGLEDTSFYRYHRLVSLNEVGGDPRAFGVTPAEFHRKTQARALSWAHGLLDTSTHDTKRSEDVRARINVLSEIPALWRKRVRHWKEINESKKILVADVEAPSRNDEYLLYQVLLGAWPLGHETPGKGEEAGSQSFSFCRRIQQFMVKAAREAKEKTSWSNPHPDYEASLSGFVEKILTSAEGHDFLADFVPFARYVTRIGMFNSLSQTLIKLSAPGVPGIYQGNELWQFDLVDPDNRHSVDYTSRQAWLSEFEKCPGEDRAATDALLTGLTREMDDGRIKLYLSWKALGLRQRRASLFTLGDYLPLSVEGEKANHVLAFARREGNSMAVSVAPRLIAQLGGDGTSSPLDPAVWKDTRVVLPPGIETSHGSNVLTGEAVGGEKSESGSFLSMRTLLAKFPVALVTLEVG